MLDDAMLAHLMDIGEQMLVSGAEVNRVEETIGRMARAQGARRVDVFTITSSIVVSAITEGGRILSQTRRIATYDTDLERLAQLNDLARHIAAGPCPLGDIETELLRIEQRAEPPAWLDDPVFALIAASFTVFFGGGAADALVSAALGVVLKRSVVTLRHIERNTVIVHILCPFIIGSLGIGLLRLGLGRSLEAILIGNIMLLIPGLSLTNSVRDIIAGDTMAGILRMSEAVLVSLSIAIGFGLSSLLWGGWLP